MLYRNRMEKELINIFKQIKVFFISLIIMIFFFSIFFIPTVIGGQNYIENNQTEEGVIIHKNPNGFVWPLPGYTRISSPFGKRVSPTTGASSSHSGIDIPAPQGTKFVAVNDGIITFRQFLGAGGYTITLSFDNYKISYCHCDPNFIVEVGQKVEQGEVIRKSGT